MADPDLGQIDRVNPHAERLQERAGGIVEPSGQREAAACGHVDPLAEGPLVGPEAAEPQVHAQIRIAPLAPLALATRLGRIDRDPRSRRQRFELAVEAALADLLHHRSELMAEDQRPAKAGVADPGTAVRVQIAPANPHGLDPQEHSPGPRRTGPRQVLDAYIRRSVKPGSKHDTTRRHRFALNTSGIDGPEGRRHTWLFLPLGPSGIIHYQSVTTYPPGDSTMPLEVQATYENGVLKPDSPLPLDEHERVTVSVKPQTSRIRESAGLLKWTGDPKALEYLLGPENLPWANP